MAANGTPSYYQNAMAQIEAKSPYPQTRDLPEEINTTARQVPSVRPPATFLPTDDQLFATDSRGRRKPNHEFIREHFLREGRLREEHVMSILRQATDLLSSEANVLKVKSPVTVVGDIHGQYYDLMKIFEVGGSWNDNNYLFLGDYVDRGCFGIECLLYLYVLKLWYPEKIFLMRGNHECAHLTEYFTFKRECLHKYSEKVYQACCESFNALPIAALLDSKFFCVHGGISPELNTLSDLDRLNRFQEPGSFGLLCDLLWSDPIPNFGHETEPSQNGPGVAPGTLWLNNDVRGCSYFFTYEAVIKFLERNNLLGVIRGHEAQDAGYTMFRKTPTKKFPSVITVFSAPNYLDVYHNRGAVLKYANKNITIRQYHARPHPYWLPNFMDAFTWSLPFVGQKIVDALLAILKVCSEEELEDISSDEEEAEGAGAASESDLAARRQEIKNKILVVGKMQRLFQILRFDDARRFDVANERLPEQPPAPTAYPGLAAPSMRAPLMTHLQQRAGTPTRSGASTPSEEASTTPTDVPGAWPGTMEELIRRTLNDDDEGGVVERLAERISRSRRPTGKPRPLKRHETT
ncbi:unnamed protein product [Peniophora sp. CBMAI 1063]|nr:unnamed protein product [Peniophora sp. CBMAI 1063]